jgi:hypothetical protein
MSNEIVDVDMAFPRLHIARTVPAADGAINPCVIGSERWQAAQASIFGWF